jgi:hypothetical protein
MTFEEAGQQYVVLRGQRDAGQLAEAAFRQRVADLVVIDANGVCWQLDPDAVQWQVSRRAAPAAAGAVRGAPTHALPRGGDAPTPARAPSRAPSRAQPATPAQPVATGTGWGQRLWDVFSVVGSTAMSAVWYWYSSLADTRGDIKTCSAMIILPVALILLRKPLESLLRPLEPVRSKIPPMVLAGCGVAIPFLVANYLYSTGQTQFPYMFKTYVYSTLITYVVLRSPSSGRPPMPAGVSTQAGTI